MEETMERYRKRIDSREHIVGVIGLGYVGLPLAMAAVSQGFKTVGFDIDNKKVVALKKKETYLRTVPQKKVAETMETGLFTPTTDFSGLTRVDTIIICVPTPLTSHREPDMSFIVSTGESVVPFLRKNHSVILESTTYPGTTDEVLQPILEKSGLVCGRDFALAFSPEREDPGNKHFETRTIPKVIGGVDKESSERVVYLYGKIFKQVVPVSDARVAEAVKLSENIFRCVNIALVNELKMIYSKMGIDIWEVIEAASTKPFGFMPFYPGPGLGGHCIPIDPFYLTWKAHEYETATRFIEIAGEINTAMPEYVIEQLMNALNDQGKALKNAKVLVLGVAYKKDIDDMRESPSLKLLNLLIEKGAKPAYHDPYIPVIPLTRKYKQFEKMTSTALTPEMVKKYDAVLIATDHSDVDYDMIVANSPLVMDTRNATKKVKKNRKHIYKA
jgi:UDP-N-acetyl-D-glucosamine dehydrogenase